MNKLTKFLTKWCEEIFIIIWFILAIIDGMQHKWLALSVDVLLIAVGLMIVIAKKKDSP